MGVSVSVSPPGAGPDVSYRKKNSKYNNNNNNNNNKKKQNEPNGTIKNSQAKKSRSTLYRLRRELLKKDWHLPPGVRGLAATGRAGALLNPKPEVTRILCHRDHGLCHHVHRRDRRARAHPPRWRYSGARQAWCFWAWAHRQSAACPMAMIPAK